MHPTYIYIGLPSIKQFGHGKKSVIILFFFYSEIQPYSINLCSRGFARFFFFWNQTFVRSFLIVFKICQNMLAHTDYWKVWKSTILDAITLYCTIVKKYNNGRFTSLLYKIRMPFVVHSIVWKRSKDVTYYTIVYMLI